MTGAVDADRLAVWFEQRRVGDLWRDGQDRIGFQYGEDWLASGYAIGHVLPLREEPFEPGEGLAHAWFSNLLPEAGARDRIVRQLGVSDDDYSLLRRIGGDCAGALSVLPGDQPPDLTQGAEQVPEESLSQWLMQRGPYPLSGAKSSQAEHQSRLSLAGAQAKSPVLIKDGQLFLPLGATASSHILKFELPEWRNVPVYEFYLNRLAHAVSLPVPESELAELNGQRYLIVSRYDRRQKNATWHRLHQEDFCQVAGLRSTRKYQAAGGPGLADIAEWIRKLSARPAEDLLRLLRWQAFNWLAGNSDGHAKNLSLVHVADDPYEWRLAPFYDLVCTRAWPSLDQQLAMTIGDQSIPGHIGRKQWQTEAGRLKMRPAFVLAEVKALAERIEHAIEGLRSELEKRYGPLPMLQQPETVIRKQLRIARQLLDQ
jgi:serine/threonine-protein kinase HipA